MAEQSHNHHYIPVWYQKRFLAPGGTAFRILDLRRERFTLPDGSVKLSREILDNGPTRAFKAKDLYTVRLFGEPNDDIERLLFGEIDTTGKIAIEAWLSRDWDAAHDTYMRMYEFMDALRLRTPKGLVFVRAVGRARNKLQLMAWMQQIRRMHCVMWAEGVLEILSAKDSPTKFIFTDHPVTLFNRYVFPGDPRMRGLDPKPDWMGTQTIFPFDQDNLFVMTHLEWARTPGESKARKPRTNARYFDNSMVRLDKCRRDRTLTKQQVLEVNYIMKSRAYRYVAGRTDDDLFPERHLRTTLWSNLASCLTPDRPVGRGGRMTVAFNDGSFYFQDEFGRRPESKAEHDRRVEEAKRLRAHVDNLLRADGAKRAYEDNG